jgi:uncharacterized protein YqgQ
MFFRKQTLYDVKNMLSLAYLPDRLAKEIHQINTPERFFGRKILRQKDFLPAEKRA